MIMAATITKERDHCHNDLEQTGRPSGADDGGMAIRVADGVVPGPGGAEAARLLGTMVRDPLAAYVRLTARYGDAVRVPFAPRRWSFLLSRPEHAEHVLAANQDNYVKAFTYRPLRALVGDGLLTSEGDVWRRHRRLIQPVFSRRDVTRFGPQMTAAAQRLVERWAALPDGSLVNVAQEMSALTLEVVGLALFSTDLTGDADQMGRAMSAGQRVAVLATFLPLSWGPTSTRMVKAAARRLGHTAESIESPVNRLIAARRQAAKPAGTAHDLLDVLLRAREEQDAALTDAEIADEVATFMLAGHETTANTLAWTLALLSAYPAARERLEEELESVLGGRRRRGSAALGQGRGGRGAAALPARLDDRTRRARRRRCRGRTGPGRERDRDSPLPGAPPPRVLAGPGRVRSAPLPARRQRRRRHPAPL